MNDISWLQQMRDMADEYDRRFEAMSPEKQMVMWGMPATSRYLRGVADRVGDGHLPQTRANQLMLDWADAIDQYVDAISRQLCREQVDVVLMRLVRVINDTGLNAQYVLGG